MIKHQYRPGGSIKEAKQPSPKNEVKKGPDTLIERLYKPLPDEIRQTIINLDNQGVSRSQIARQVGIPKTRVVHELMSLDIKDTQSSKYAPKSYERSSTL
ncbi:hypothetical protein G9G53_22550 [Paenibacillus sp. EKM206P]|uniref:hypothetical protein n=1 Tax=Paenibacillus sp. EKM206P TaxID=1683674 RepID=UPI0013EB52DD|nr:hypothetical protein [Paenibacillus sp. EKM206P]KAF6569072.1 hypothetical protein G9G53_22550 [Paenibacillus sp. EKM206P]